jgi:pimeloyl-ACP methyl ester carboxylesterase
MPGRRGRSPDRLGALVLTNCDAFEHFPPAPFKPLVAVAKVPGGLRAALAPLRSARVRRSPVGYGALSHHDVDHLARGWVRPVLEQPEVLEDLRRFTVAIDKAVTLDAAARLPGFDRPVLLAWGADDPLFPRADAERLAGILPDARLEVIEDSRAFSMIDQPARLAGLVAAFAQDDRARLRSGANSGQGRVLAT